MEWTPTLCIFHGDCIDGFGAAYSIWKKWPGIKFAPAYHGNPVPECAGEDVLFVDFAPGQDWIMKNAGRIYSMVIIDHHKTSKAALEEFRTFDGSMIGLLKSFGEDHPSPANVSVWFDMEQSGAAMAWQFASQQNRETDKPVPMMIALIEDRDIWRNAYGDITKQFSAAIQTYPMDFKVWDRVCNDIDPVIAEGVVIWRAHLVHVKKMVENAYFESVGGHMVPVVNTSYEFSSDVGHELLKAYPEAPFAACWSVDKDRRMRWSLRSEDSRTDVSAIAKSFGGGGHRNAAGFEAAIYNI